MPVKFNEAVTEILVERNPLRALLLVLVVSVLHVQSGKHFES